MDRIKIVELKNINKVYNQKYILKNINLSIYEGERIAIIGKNGSGKTTLCEILLKIRKPSSGDIFTNFNKASMQFQETSYPKKMVVNDIIKFYIKAYKIKVKQEKLFQYFSIFGLNDIINEYAWKLSSGQKQRINLFLAYFIDPNLIILDEFSTALDVAGKEKILNLLLEFLKTDPKKTLILISHNSNEIDTFCNSLILMENGQIIEQNDKKILNVEYENIGSYINDKIKKGEA